MAHHCELCNYTTVKRFNFDKHLTSIKHIRFVEIVANVQQTPQIQPEVIPHTTEVAEVAPEFKCKYCDQKFRFKQSMYRHIKYSCRNKDNDLKEMVRLLKIEMKKQTEKLDTQQKQIDTLLNDL
jgi:hypothetical protein